MTPVARALLLAVTLVAVFVFGALALQWSLTRQMRAVEAAPRGEARAAGKSAAGSADFDRLRRLQSRTLAATLALALVLGAVPLTLALFSARRPAADTRAPWRAEAAGLERFARLTVERGAALEREHGARLRAEEDLSVSRSLLDRSLEERVRLGRELHDNVSQSLYGVALALESVRKKMTAAPEIEQRLEQCTAELRRLNQEVRAYLRELEPAAVQRTPLAQALADALAATAAHGVAVDTRLEDEALSGLPGAHTPELVNLVREAASNAVRHGGARRITLRAVRGDDAVALAIADDGAGFDPAATSSGHGLANMRARAAALGGILHVESAPGQGTRVVLTLPIAPASA
jgi:signal transduction histidine kinase